MAGKFGCLNKRGKKASKQNPTLSSSAIEDFQPIGVEEQYSPLKIRESRREDEYNFSFNDIYDEEEGYYRDEYRESSLDEQYDRYGVDGEYW